MAQNVGRWPARFELFGYRMCGDLVIVGDRSIFHFCSAAEVDPGALYSYEAEIETSYPLLDLHFTSEPLHDKKSGAPSYGKGKFMIERLTWAGHPVKRAIVMHSPIGMAR